MHHTKDKGDLGVLKIQANLAEQGFIILHPLTEHAPFDVVAYKDGLFYRVQVKYRELKNGCLRVKFKSTWTDRHGTHETPIDKSKIDLIAIYCPNNHQCYYINPNEFNNSVCLRVENSKNIYMKDTEYNFAKDYLKIPVVRLELT